MQSNPRLNPVNMNTSYPGFIYNFDPATQTAEVQMAIETLFVGLDCCYSTKKKNRLQDVPVQFQRGGGWAMTFPIPDGTPCYVEFAQRGIDHWLIDGAEGAGLRSDGMPDYAFDEYFSVNNAVAHLGICPITAAISNFATDGAELRNADATQSIKLQDDGTISIKSASTTFVIKKDGDIVATTTAKAEIKAKSITLDGDTTVTKSLTVIGASNLNGGVSAKGGSGDAVMNITGAMKITSTINGVQVESHQHHYTWTSGSGSADTDPPKKN
ncbi:Gp138 family membrane-puncturing spike protein [Enterobacter ludwigii]|uniref:Gp138 family membrane-puncturing spike protein n=1 Tax=Enterobacter ludwigii TaxID=299767 RepID=UPI003BEEBEDF